LEIENLELYHEIVIFRSLLLIFTYGFYVTYSAFLIRIPCNHCDTPYRMMAIALVSTYGIRIFCLLWNLFFNFHFYRLMTTEVDMLKHSTSDYRFFFKVVPDLSRNGSLSVSTGIELAMFMITLAFALLNTLWIAQDLCEKSCPRIFHAYEYLQVALYLLEVSYVISVLILRYLKRTLGIEGIEKIIDLVIGKEEDEEEEEEPEFKDPYTALYGNDGDMDPADSHEDSGDDDESLATLRLAHSFTDEPKKVQQNETK